MLVPPAASPEVTGGNYAEGGANIGQVELLNRGGEELFAVPGEGRWAVTLNEVCVVCK